MGGVRELFRGYPEVILKLWYGRLARLSSQLTFIGPTKLIPNSCTKRDTFYQTVERTSSILRSRRCKFLGPKG